MVVVPGSKMTIFLIIKKTMIELKLEFNKITRDVEHDQ